MNQVASDFTAAREQGRTAAEACTDKAERTTSFNTDAAGKFIVGQLVRYGDMSGEMLVDAAIAHGHRPHDARAFGAVFAGLARKGLIRTAGYCLRTKGNATAGGRVWGLVR